MYPERLASIITLASNILVIISYVMGVGFVVLGIFKLKRYGEMRTQMSSQMSILSPLMPIIVGVLLVRFPHFFGETMQMFFGKTGTADLAYPSTGGGFEQYIKPIMMLVRLIGVIAIIRGLVLLSRVGNPQSQPGSTGKALIHIIGGIMAARIGEVISFIKMLIGQGG